VRILALETSTPAGSLAVMEEKGLLGEVFINVSVSHSRRIMPSLEWLLSEIGLTIDDIDGYTISIGPGSFTGLRIGLSTIKGLAMATGKPVVGISSLEALAWNIAGGERVICPMIDARKKEVYSALYRRDDRSGLVCIQEEQAIDPGRMLDKCPEDTVFLGSGAALYHSMIRERFGSRDHFPPPHLMNNRASSVAALAFNRFLDNDVDDLNALVPRYLRPSEAELKWAGRESS